MRWIDHAAFAGQRDGALDFILQFSYIAWPIERQQGRQCRLIQANDPFMLTFLCFIEEPLGQHGNVFGALSQRRNSNPENGQ